MHRGHIDNNTKAFNLYYISKEDGRIPKNNNPTRGTRRGTIDKIIKSFWAKLSNELVIKIFTFSLLQTYNSTLAFLNFCPYFSLSII
jgi:hypothetical protein